MKILSNILIFFFLLFSSSVVFAEIYTYKDDKGTKWYVNRIESIPQQYRHQVEDRKVHEVVPGGEWDLAQTSASQGGSIRNEGIPFLTRKYLNIDIEGDEDFLYQVEEALALLRFNAPLVFRDVLKHVGRIEEWEETNMWIDEEPPTMTLEKNSVLYSRTFTAAVIVQQMCYSRMFFERGIMLQENEEGKKECQEITFEAMRLVGSPQYEFDKILADSQEETELKEDKGIQGFINKPSTIKSK